jgi:hypothetical protein
MHAIIVSENHETGMEERKFLRVVVQGLVDMEEGLKLSLDTVKEHLV